MIVCGKAGSVATSCIGPRYLFVKLPVMHTCGFLRAEDLEAVVALFETAKQELEQERDLRTDVHEP